MQETTTKDTKIEEAGKLKGKYIESVGRRKTAVARIRFFKKGTGEMIVNNMKIANFFIADHAAIVKQPLKQAGIAKEVDISIIAKGGGKKCQAEAARHGITLALVKMDEKLKPSLKAKGWMTRDAREKERKKPGLKKARRAPQWSKR